MGDAAPEASTELASPDADEARDATAAADCACPASVDPCLGASGSPHPLPKMTVSITANPSTVRPVSLKVSNACRYAYLICLMSLATYASLGPHSVPGLDAARGVFRDENSLFKVLE